MSGGVDSSVAAALLVEQGYDVVGATMKLFCYGDNVPDRPCCSLDSINDARTWRAPARHSALRHQFRGPLRAGRHREFRRRVRRGRTPIPCVRCNSFTKFRDLLAHADALDCAYIATGHYAARATARSTAGAIRQGPVLLPVGNRPGGGRPHAGAGRRAHQGGDARSGRAARTGDRRQAGVRRSASSPTTTTSRVLERHLPADAPALSPGPLVTSDGDVVGEHEDSPATRSASGAGCRAEVPPALRAGDPPRGSRRGPGRRGGAGQPPGSARGAQLAGRAAGEATGARCRFATARAAVSATVVTALARRNSLLESDAPIRAVTPGQSGVLYDAGGRVLGGGVIS